MSFLNIKQLIISTALVLTILITIQGIGSLFSGNVNVSDIDLAEIQTQERVDDKLITDYTKVFARYEALQPAPVKEEPAEQNTEDELLANEKANSIDKELKPNFENLNDDYQVGLVAVFEQPKRFAVLQMLNYQSGQSEYKKLALGDAIGSYQLNKINKLSVVLSNQTSQLELYLFKPRTQS